MPLNILIVRHTPYEGVAGFRLPMEEAGFAIDRVDVTDADFPNTDLLSPDLLVMMGGPMGVYEGDRHPWIGHEIVRLAERIAAGRPVLGVCLGAQMIAAAMGARVRPGPVREVGFAPVELTAAGRASPLFHLRGVPLLHWHGDTFDLPPGAELLARTVHYPQAFRRGRNLLALQCHPEMGEDARFGAWLEGSDDYLASAGTDRATLSADYPRFGPAAVAAGRTMLRDWLAGLDL